MVYVEKSGNGMAVAALVCGIVGLVLALIPILFFVGWGLGITAFVLGLVSRRRASRDPKIGRKAMATWGVALGVLSFLMGCVGYAILDDAFNDLDEDLSCIEKADNQKELDECD